MGATGVASAANRSGRGAKGRDAREPQSPTRGTGQVSSVKQAGGHGMRMFGGLLERQLPFKRVKTAVVSFMSPLGACPALPSGASQASPAESLKYETLPVSSEAVAKPPAHLAGSRVTADARDARPCRLLQPVFRADAPRWRTKPTQHILFLCPVH